MSVGFQISTSDDIAEVARWGYEWATDTYPTILSILNVLWNAPTPTSVPVVDAVAATTPTCVTGAGPRVISVRTVYLLSVPHSVMLNQIYVHLYYRIDIAQEKTMNVFHGGSVDEFNGPTTNHKLP